MSFDRWITLHVTKPLQTHGLWPKKPGIPILMYHSISDDPEPGVSPYYRLCTPPKLFREQMSCLRDNGYAVLDLGVALRMLGSETIPERAVILTFDDGLLDFQENAWPILQEFGYGAIVFLSTAFIGDDQHLSFKGRHCLKWGDIRALQAHGILFGSHTVNHAILHSLNWPEIERELEQSKKTLEDQLGALVDHFSYPFAYPQADAVFCRRFNETLDHYGYRSCLTTRIGRARLGDPRWNLKRLPVNGSDDPSLFCAKIEGAYDWLHPVQYTLKSINNQLLAYFHPRN